MTKTISSSRLPRTAVVLAGERPGGNALARAHSSPSSLTIDLNGRAVIDWTLAAIERSSIERMLVVGPGAGAATDETVVKWLEHPAVGQISPATGPAASALEGALAADEWPLLLTAADHALLRPELIDQFCVHAQHTAATQNADLVVGLVDYPLVHQRFPESRRTVLKFADGGCCGSNLFYLASKESARVLRVWSDLEALRKTPWKIAMKLGLGVCLGYLFGRLTVDRAFTILSKRAGAKVTYCKLAEAELAVDVDSVADLALASNVLLERARDDVARQAAKAR